MIRYKVCGAEIIDGIVELPDNAIPLKIGLIFTKPLNDPNCKLRDGVKYLLPEEEKK